MDSTSSSYLLAANPRHYYVPICSFADQHHEVCYPCCTANSPHGRADQIEHIFFPQQQNSAGLWSANACEENWPSVQHQGQDREPIFDDVAANCMCPCEIAHVQIFDTLSNAGQGKFMVMSSLTTQAGLPSMVLVWVRLKCRGGSGCSSAS